MKQKLPLIILLSIILLAAFLRLYRISDYMTFLGDEGRDVLVAKGILEGSLTLLGPRSSAGDFFMGPAYYYMITPFLGLFQLDPVGPAVMVAVLSVATVWLIYFVGKRFFDEKAGLFAAALYAVAPVVINYSHSSWNPNVLPFFSLLLIYTLYKAIGAPSNWKYFVGIGILLGIAIQLHYLALFLIVISVLFLFLGGWYHRKKITIVLLIKQYAQMLLGFLIGFSPFLAFEVRHDFLNTKAIYQFIFGDTLQGAYQAQGGFFAIVSEVFFRIFGRLVFHFPSPDLRSTFSDTTVQLWSVIVVMAVLVSLGALLTVKKKLVALLLGVWLFISLSLFGLYKDEIYDYHFMLLFPLPFLLVGNFFSWLFTFKKKMKIVGAVISCILFISLFLFNLSGMPFRHEPNRQKVQVKTIVEFVIEKAENKPFNFALITLGNSDHGYRYYFEVLNRKPLGIENTMNDPQRKSVTKQLLVVCEDPNCQPLGHSLFEVAGFGRASIAAEWNVLVVKVYKLVPYVEPEEKRE